MSSARYIIGIDLGTTNTAAAFVDLRDESRRVQSLSIPQLVREGIVESRGGLPSFLYLAGEHDISPGALALPWESHRTYAVGELAREQGARVPGRLVSSAKSWLCHGGVDREARILPWGAPADVDKVSPVRASARYLQHLREVWLNAHPDAPMEQQVVVLTVPASFDEVARELTVQAAEQAGLPRVILLEEPQAAFYAWLHHHEQTWEDELAGVNLAVVIDVGGGTTDFSLVAVNRQDGRLALERMAVGDHLLLGGDNVDVALARQVEPRLGGKLDSQRWHALTNLCRGAKEALLSGEAGEEMTIRLVGRGGAVVGGTLSATIRRSEVEELVVEGFFPRVAADASPRKSARAALQEWGLPFAVEPEITRHLATFLSRNLQSGVGDARGSLPDAILFNGGALKPEGIRERLTDLLAEWRNGSAPSVLTSEDLDLAVARGAAYYGLVRRGRGIRIAGGSPRAYYLGIGGASDGGGTTAEGEPARQMVLCIAHRGMQEGEEIEVGEPPLEVIANRAVTFPLYASSTRLGERAGQLVQAEVDSLTELPPIRTVLRFGRKMVTRALPVSVVTHLTEVGTLELWCRSLTTEHRWRLQFQLRDQAADADIDPAVIGHDSENVLPDASVDAAASLLSAAYPAPGQSGSGDPVTLMRQLEQAMGAGKDAWPLSSIRKLWDVLWAGAESRGLTPAHEARWLNLCGHLLRPGFGAELDDFRLQQLWRMRSAGLKFAKAAQSRAEWWSLWKRIAGGLNRQQQLQLHQEVAPFLLPRLKAKAKTTGPKPGPQEIREYWQLMGSCERLSAEIKAELGNVLIGVFEKGKASDTELWVLARLGARHPLYGPLNCVVHPDTAVRWVQAILAAPWDRPERMLFPLVQLARFVGDRERDLDEATRAEIAERLRPLPAGERAARLMTEVVPLAAPERARIMDESLPAGLQLRQD